VSTAATVIFIAVGVFLVLTWLFWRRAGVYVAPGLGAVGGGTAMIAVGGVLVVKGHAIAGLALDAVGAISIWAALKTYSQLPRLDRGTQGSSSYSRATVGAGGGICAPGSPTGQAGGPVTAASAC
jgi:hypothetical protein